MLPDHIGSRYRVIRELGRGGMGIVYLVEHLHTGERLALKVLHGAAAADPGAIARFKREARVGAQLRSEHVVRITDADVATELDGAPFFVMELLDGLDLEKLVENVGALAPDVVVAILSQIAGPLDKAHASGIVHRDLKPENIFLDFGISKFLLPDVANAAALGTTADGTLMGTPHYMAPEQARGLIDAIGPATDVWAMGLIALRMLTGAIYWTAATQADLMVEILVAPMAAPSTRWPIAGGAKFDAWFLRSCHRSPSERWRSVSEQIAALAEALRDSVHTGGAGARRGASVVTVHQALQQASGAGLPAGIIPAFGLPTPESRTSSITRTPLRGELPLASPRSISAGNGTMAPAIGTSDAEDIEAMRPRWRKLAVALGAGLAAGLGLVYVLVSPGGGPTVATPSPAVVAPVPSSLTANPTGEKATSLSYPLPATVDAGAARTDFEDFEAPLPVRGTARPDSPGPRRALPPTLRRQQPQAMPPAPRAPAPTSPPQDDPLAP
jgi:serine/threonine protein kinase